MQVIFDPIFNYFSPFILCLKFPCKKRQKTCNRAEEKLNDELELTSLLHKISNMHGMLQYLMTERHKNLMTYHSDKVINVDTTDEEEDHVDDDKEKLIELELYEFLNSNSQK